MKLKKFLQIFGVIAIVLTLIPLIAADYWWIRVFDFPHIQLTLLTLTAIAAYFLRFDIKRYEDYAFMVILLICFTFQFLKVFPYTPLYSYEANESTIEDSERKFKIFTANVLQKNEEHQVLIDEVKRHDADVIVFTETDAIWQSAISKSFGKDYPYKAEMPLDNTYGMLLYSKLKLKNTKIKFIVDDSIPSIHTEIKLRSGDKIQLYAIHPTPPMPQHNPSSSDRDAEIMKIAKLVKDAKHPSIVIGDFNDVSWSSTTSLFQDVGGLLDVRVGRGFYNSFNAKNPILRWPLDHIFVTEHFRVEDVELGKDTKSDHFPFGAVLSLEPSKAEAQEPDAPTEKQLEQADEQIQEEEEENVERGES